MANLRSFIFSTRVFCGSPGFPRLSIVKSTQNQLLRAGPSITTLSKRTRPGGNPPANHIGRLARQSTTKTLATQHKPRSPRTHHDSCDDAKAQEYLDELKETQLEIENSIRRLQGLPDGRLRQIDLYLRVRLAMDLPGQSSRLLARQNLGAPSAQHDLRLLRDAEKQLASVIQQGRQVLLISEVQQPSGLELKRSRAKLRSYGVLFCCFLCVIEIFLGVVMAHFFP